MVLVLMGLLFLTGEIIYRKTQQAVASTTSGITTPLVDGIPAWFVLFWIFWTPPNLFSSFSSSAYTSLILEVYAENTSHSPVILHSSQYCSVTWVTWFISCFVGHDTAIQGDTLSRSFEHDSLIFARSKIVTSSILAFSMQVVYLPSHFSLT